MILRVDWLSSSHLLLLRLQPVALVSWGRTLELPTATSAELCHWLEATLLTGQKPGGASAGRKYNLLLTRPAEQQQQQVRLFGCGEKNGV